MSPTIQAFANQLNSTCFLTVPDGSYELKTAFDAKLDGQPVAPPFFPNFTIRLSVKDGKVWAYGVQGDFSDIIMPMLRSAYEKAQNESVPAKTSS